MDLPYGGTPTLSPHSRDPPAPDPPLPSTAATGEEGGGAESAPYRPLPRAVDAESRLRRYPLPRAAPKAWRRHICLLEADVMAVEARAADDGGVARAAGGGGEGRLEKGVRRRDAGKKGEAERPREKEERTSLVGGGGARWILFTSIFSGRGPFHLLPTKK